MNIEPRKWIVHKKSGETKAVEKVTYIPAHEREEIETAYSGTQIIDLLDRVKDALLKGGNAAGFEKIDKLKDKVELDNSQKNDSEVEH